MLFFYAPLEGSSLPWDNEEEFQFLLHGEEKVMKRQFSDPTIPAFFEAHPKRNIESHL